MVKTKKEPAEIVGFVAGALTTLSFLPQVILVWGMRPLPAVAISFPMYIAFCFGVSGWMIYGTMIKSRPVIAWNAITLAFALSVLVYKLMYG